METVIEPKDLPLKTLGEHSHLPIDLDEGKDMGFQTEMLASYSSFKTF